MDISTLRRQLTEELRGAWGDEATSLVRSLMCDELGIGLTELIMRDRDELGAVEVASFREKAKRLERREPLQYVTGQAMFCGHTFHVERGVLIPRPETEELVEQVVETAKDMRVVKIMDIGTGSGCIAISVKKALGEKAEVTGIDVSEEALAIARNNAERLGADVIMKKCDILHETPVGNQYDIVVSNPPYVRESERAGMTADVLDYEPWLALFVSDEDPLIFYREIAIRCREGLLRQGGELLFEINEVMGEAMVVMLGDEGYEEVKVIVDYTGRERMVRAKLKTEK